MCSISGGGDGVGGGVGGDDAGSCFGELSARASGSRHDNIENQNAEYNL